MAWEQSSKYPNGTVSEYRQSESGAKVWLHGRRWVASPFGMMLRGEKGGIRMFNSAEAAMAACEREIAELANVKSPYFRVSKAA
ncbi:hypothetical protein [Oricola thermophila]|uniref:Uncharacterized protein n=1 Tax=Oricola thermophila TaxID=2742145 RepID=A0A6N1VH61_9HYPH|nr:hypothetical protein [Oricola thermophila]QKV20276.1 hypothetical protein HTY61_18360 [Oricola thermophila]